MTITVGSTFSGIGGFELAAQQAGMATLWSSEINADARSVLCHHFPESKLHGDIAEIGSHNADAVDLLCGGFPCQDLSVAGKRAGLAGERSGLFYEFARLAAEIRPTWIVLENVPGLLSSQRGADMAAVIGTLCDIGYGLAWRVLDAQNFGVPQRRRRVVIVGHLGNVERAGTVLFEPEGSGGDSPPSGEAQSVVAALTANGVGTCGADDNQAQAGHLIAQMPGQVPALTSRCGNTQDDQRVGQLVTIGFSHTQGLDCQPSESAWPTLRAEGNGHAVAFSQNQRGELVESPYMHSLSTAGGKPGEGYPAVRVADAVRRLTPLECERLQGFPDGWTDVPNAKGKPMSDSARYRMLGNAIAVPVFRWVLERVAQVHAQ